jgi:uncharacterized membrane protein YfcA
MMSLVAPAVAPALSGWRTITIALGCALLIGGIGGLIGLGGGEFRLPVLVALIGFTARAAVPMNQILSLVTLVTALIVRWHTGSLVGVGNFAPAVIALGIGGVTAAWFAARLLSRVTDHRLERAIAVLLMAIGLLLIGERLLPAGLPALVPAELGWQMVAGVALGLCIGTASTFLGVAGGELLIPTLIFVFGADIHTAGSAVLFIQSRRCAWGCFATAAWACFPATPHFCTLVCLWELKALLVRRQAGRSPGQHRPKCSSCCSALS